MRYQTKSILWAIGMTLLVCLLYGHFNPYTYPPSVPQQQYFQSSPSMHLTGIPTHMTYTELK